MLTVEPMSGYDMKKFCEQSLAHFWHESYGNLYPRLKRLKTAGLVKARRERRSGGPDATVYSLTASGRRSFLRWLGKDPEVEHVRSEFLLKIFFGAGAGLAGCERLIAENLQRQLDIRKRYVSIRTLIAADKKDSHNASYWLMSLRRGELLTDARLKWCRESLRTIDELRAKGGKR